jgi:hypothetical protein
MHSLEPAVGQVWELEGVRKRITEVDQRLGFLRYELTRKSGVVSGNRTCDLRFWPRWVSKATLVEGADDAHSF